MDALRLGLVGRHRGRTGDDDDELAEQRNARVESFDELRQRARDDLLVRFRELASDRRAALAAERVAQCRQCRRDAMHGLVENDRPPLALGFA